jgi:hypothetical protein
MTNSRGLLEWFNSIDAHIKFTLEEEKEGNLNYLDVSISRKTSGFETSWYKKPSHTLTLDRWDSNSSKRYKANVVRTMVERIFKISSNELIFQKSIEELKEMLRNSGYPEYIIKLHVKRSIFLVKTSNLDQNLQNNTGNQKVVYFGLRYCSERTLYFAWKLKRLVKQFFPSINCSTYFKKETSLLHRFSCKIKPKNPEVDSGVYKIRCRDCNLVYIGETSRSLKLRVHEHRSLINKPDRSAIAKHSSDTNHTIDFENARVTMSESHDLKRKYAEAILINSQPVFATNTASIPLWIFK